MIPDSFDPCLLDLHVPTMSIQLVISPEWKELIVIKFEEHESLE